MYCWLLLQIYLCYFFLLVLCSRVTYLFRAVLSCKRCLICADFSPDSDQTTFSLEEALLWTHILAGSNGLKFLVSPDINWWTGVVWITCGLLWCFYQLFGLSFWRHPFTAEHPLLRQWCSDTFLQIWWRNKLIYILDSLWMSRFSAHFHIWLNYSFKWQARVKTHTKNKWVKKHQILVCF